MTKLPEHLFVSETDNGALYDTRLPNWATNPPLRQVYRKHVGEIETVADFKAALRAGGFAWPGGYPMYFVTHDGEPLSFDTAKKEFRRIVQDFIDYGDTRQGGSGWRVMGSEINYEDSDMRCSHSGEKILSAYCDDSES